MTEIWAMLGTALIMYALGLPNAALVVEHLGKNHGPRAKVACILAWPLIGAAGLWRLWRP